MKNQTIKTKRLLLRPREDTELETLIMAEPDEEMKKAYSDMLQGCTADAEHRLWYTDWEITRRSDGQYLGSLCFKGPAKEHETEIGYGLEKPFWGQGYTTEAAGALIDWAFGQDAQLYFIAAETEEDNAASRRVLEKLKFLPDGVQGEEGPRFSLQRPASAWMSIYMCLGMCFGVSLGSAFDNMAIGLCIGVAIGMCIGLSMDSAGKKKMEAALAARRARLGIENMAQ